jgi:hypothetical protein
LIVSLDGPALQTYKVIKDRQCHTQPADRLMRGAYAKIDHLTTADAAVEIIRSGALKPVNPRSLLSGLTPAATGLDQWPG